MNSSQKEEEGHQLLAEAEKLLASKSGFFRIFSSSTGTKEQAAETFVRAANSFKLAKAWNLAGDALVRAAETFADLPDMQFDAASKYTDAAKAYKNVDPKKAISPYESAVTLHAEAARFQQCARFKKEVAEIYEAERDSENALATYTAAADYYDMDDAKSNANTMRLKVANLTALAGDYQKAADIFEQSAQAALTSNLLRYGAREHLLRAGLCRLCLSDIVGSQRAVERYGSMDSSFPSSREGRLLESIVQAVDESDVEAFTNVVYEYDSISKLDEWKTTLMLKIKNNMKAVEDDLT